MQILLFLLILILAGITYLLVGTKSELSILIKANRSNIQELLAMRTSVEHYRSDTARCMLRIKSIENEQHAIRHLVNGEHPEGSTEKSSK